MIIKYNIFARYKSFLENKKVIPIDIAQSADIQYF